MDNTFKFIGHRDSLGRGCVCSVSAFYIVSQNNFIIFCCQVSSQFCTLKIIEIGSFFAELFKKQ